MHDRTAHAVSMPLASGHAIRSLRCGLSWLRSGLYSFALAGSVGASAQPGPVEAVFKLYDKVNAKCEAKLGRPLSASGKKYSLACAMSVARGGSAFDLAGLLGDDLDNPANRSILNLQPPGISDASGSGTNLGRNGDCVVGFQDAAFFTPYHAFRWTPAGGPVDLGTLEPANNASRTSFATDVASDCSVVVGLSDTTSSFIQHAFRWTAAGGMVDLGVPAGASRTSAAFGVSGDGAVVVGEAEFADAAAFTGFRKGAFRWSGGSFQPLGSLVAGFPSLATAITADGTVIVGRAITAGGSSAFRWTQATGMVSIGNLPGLTHALATGVSDTGKIVVGTVSSSPLDFRGSLGFDRGTGAFRWTAAAGMKDLRQLLIDAGVDMTASRWSG